MKATKLPEEYIVECETQEQTIEVLNKYYNSNYTSLNLWKYIICRKDLQRKNKAYGRAIEHFIRDEYKDMPIFFYEEWKELISKFVLPKRWCIRGIVINRPENKILRKYFDRFGGGWYITSPDAFYFVEKNTVQRECSIPEGYTEITFEQFEKYVLKEVEPEPEYQEETKTNKTMKKPFAITGSTILKEAFVKEAGLKPLAFDSVPDYYKYLAPYSKNVVIGHTVLGVKSIEFSLPKDYDEALKYVKTYWDEEKVKAKEGDWIVPLVKSGEGESGGHCREVGKAYLVNGVCSERVRVFTEDGILDGNGSICHGEYRLATPEEIKKVTEFHKGDWVTVTKLANITWVSSTPQRTFQLVGEAPFYASNYMNNEKSGLYGLRGCAFRKATKEEIEKAKKLKEPQFPEINGYKGVIEGNLFAYGCKKFNKEELDTIIEASNLLKRLDGYFPSITDNSVIVKSTAISIDDLKRASKLLSKKKLEYGGDIKNFPEEVVEKMLDRQVEQGNPRNLSVFEGNKSEGKSSGGFNWKNSTEGGNFWLYVIGYQEFDKFFELYPKNN